MRNHLLCTACAAVIGLLTAGTALAQPASTNYSVAPQLVVGGDYSYLSVNNGGGSANVGGGGLAGIMPLGNNFSAQISGAYHDVSANHGGNLNDWNVAGAAAWSPSNARVGVNVAYTDLSSHGISGDVTNYGAFGEYYVTNEITVGARGGGLDATGHAFGASSSASGYYLGGEIVVYPVPDLSLQASTEYDSVSHANQTVVGVTAEYLLSHSTPLSIWAGYNYADLGGEGSSSISSNTVSVGIRFYFDGGSGALVDRHRTGVDNWGAAPFDLRF